MFGMLLDFRKAQLKHSPIAARVFFYAFLTSSNILRVWIRVSKHEKPFGISLITVSKPVNPLQEHGWIREFVKSGREGENVCALIAHVYTNTTFTQP